MTCATERRAVAVPEPERAAARAPAGGSRGMWGLACLLPLLFGSASCGTLYGAAGGALNGYAERHIMPFMLRHSDLEMACQTGGAFTNVLGSFARVTRESARASLMLHLAAGLCVHEQTQEAELRRLRALKAGRPEEAKDALIEERRAHVAAAQRFLRAYQHAVNEFGLAGGSCSAKLSDRESPVIYLLGLSSGLLAILHDRAAGGQVGVPLDIPRRVARASTCIDDRWWWGVPSALRAAVWASVPGSAPDGVDPWAVFAEAARLGDLSGVRLARAFQVQQAASVGREVEARRSIKEHAASLQRKAAPGEWRMLDLFATRMILHESDKAWTTATGHRTPEDAFGSFAGE